MNARYITLSQALAVEKRRTKCLESEVKNLTLLLRTVTHDARSFLQFRSIDKRSNFMDTLDVAERIIGKENKQTI